ncbi:GNAT family N-acetyltransferase [Alphaproteobacteria bacterium]|nr:GNAT family N-acetyltransferase [Alphaproteobacteria bacterium]
MKLQSLRKVSMEDMDLIFRWRNLDSLVDLSTEKKKVSFLEHKIWFQEKISSKCDIIRIIVVDDEDAGLIRFDLKKTKYFVSVYLIPKYQGFGLGEVCLREAIGTLFEQRTDFVAIIEKDNSHSRTIFERNGFRFQYAYGDSEYFLREKE